MTDSKRIQHGENTLKANDEAAAELERYIAAKDEVMSNLKFGAVTWAALARQEPCTEFVRAASEYASLVKRIEGRP